MRPTDPPVLQLRTPRLLMRQWGEADNAPFAALNADPEVMAHFPWTLTADESRALAYRYAAGLEVDGYGIWALEVLGSGAFIGFVGLARPTWESAFTPCTEIGWRLTRDAWGHGYATEAARAALRVAFTHVGLDEVVSFTAAGNVRSRAVMERLGMHRDVGGDFDHPRIAEGHPTRRHVLYRLTVADWATLARNGSARGGSG
ncbi:MAG: GNAT family N-acetyltransferase [Lapillicoccus sp.]